MNKTLKQLNAEKKWTKTQLMFRYHGRYVDVYPWHHEYWNDTKNRFETVYEVRGVSKTVRENYQSPHDV